MSGPAAESWIRVRPRGLYVVPGDFYIDPSAGVDTAVVTHGHGDHLRPGHRRVLATAETLAIMDVRLPRKRGPERRALAYGERIGIGDATVRLAPAGHVLGSAQVVVEHRGTRVVVSGDYKRRPDPTCPPFEPVPCDVFVTEATFGLPVFRHPDAAGEIARLLDSLRLFPDRAHVVGVYALGKAQRIAALLRAAGYDRPIRLHPALGPLFDLYRRFGIELGPTEPVAAAAGGRGGALAGEVVLAPPPSLGEDWARRLADPLAVAASGWMGTRRRARGAGELPLVISDHADWDELLRTFREVGAPEIWATHGREDAIVRAATAEGLRARPLACIGAGPAA